MAYGVVEEGCVMGIIGNAISFGAGYAVGAQKGYEPIKRGARRLGGAMTDRMPAIGSLRMGGNGMANPRQVREVMTGAPQTINANGTLAEAARMMRDNGIGDVIVTEGERPVGIVTDRDIAVKVVADGKDPAAARVRDVTGNLVTVAPTDSVSEAMRRMRDKDIRRLPVVESERVIGVVSLGDLSVLPEAGAVLADVSSAPPNS
jgi:CBS domain-containing protein